MTTLPKTLPRTQNTSPSTEHPHDVIPMAKQQVAVPFPLGSGDDDNYWQSEFDDHDTGCCGGDHTRPGKCCGS